MVDFAIVGGDDRLVYMAEMLTREGYDVIVYALSREPDEAVRMAKSLRKAVREAENIIAPVPASRDGLTINGIRGVCDLTLDALRDALNSGKRLFAGCIPADLADFCRDGGIPAHDYMESEELALFNSIATAEGAVAEAVISKPENLHQSRCLVLGFGRCAKTLARKLAGLDAGVTVCARRESARAEADCMGCETMDFTDLPERIAEFDYIFNTVPGKILTDEALFLVKRDVLILDISSAPGCLDFAAAEKMGIRAKLCLGLPGKYAPKASAKALVRYTLEKIPHERE